MINENQVGEILSRRQRNESISQIARTMNLSRPTVRRYANMPEEQAQQARTHQKLNRCSILDEYRDQIERIFYDTEGNCVNVQEVFAKLHPEMQPSLRLIQWYCQKEGFRSCLRHTRATKHTRSIETPPGFEVQIDFGEKTVSVNSEPTTIHFFTATLGYSRKIYAVFYKAENFEAWAHGLEQTFLHFGGIPRHVVCDNAKALVYQPAANGQPIEYNKRFKAICRYWGTNPQACKPHNPEEKGKVERTVSYVKSSFLKDFRAFTSLEDIQEKFELWTEQWADKRRMHTAVGLPFTPRERFTLDKAALLPISKPPLNNYRLEKRKVGIGGLITVDYCRYQLPAELTEQSVDLMIGVNTIVVLHQGSTIARLDKNTDAVKSMARILKRDANDMVGKALAANTWVANSLKYNPLGRSLSDYEEAARW